MRQDRPVDRTVWKEPGNIGMNTEKLAGILGAFVAAVALGAAFIYGPIGQTGKPAEGQKAAPAAPVATTPPVRGPVVREVPQWV
jgi:hypothetical protein